MFFKKKVKKEKLVLYKKYLSDQNKVEDSKVLESSLENKSDIENERKEDIKEKKKQRKKVSVPIVVDEELNEKQEKIKKPKKEKNEKKNDKSNILLKGKITIGIMSLSDENTGCRHLALTIALQMKKDKKNVCIVNYGRAIESDICRVYRNKSEIDTEEYDHYDCIIYLVGNNSRFASDDFKYANYKLVLCLYQEEYNNRLYNFTSRYDQEFRFNYIFNFVSPKNEKYVHELMEDYHHICLPLYNIDDSKVIHKITKQIFSK